MVRIFTIAVLAVELCASSVAMAAGPAPSLFAGDGLLELKLTAAWTDLLAKARTNAEYTVPGTLTYVDEAGKEKTIDGLTVALRGHTSKQETECDFPKLKIGFKGDQSGTPFASIETLKIGTHCGDRDDGSLTEKYGRWANEKAPHREAFVYRLLAVMKMPTLQARPARITYVGGGPNGEALVRNALLLEDDDDAMQRLGAREQVTEMQFSSARQMFAPRDAARLAFAEAMIGNFDWCVRFFPGDTYRCDDRHPLWNVMAFKTPQGTIPVPYDFDLSGPVTGRHTWFHKVFNVNMSPSKSEAEVEVLQQVQRTRMLFDRQDLDAVRAELVATKGAALDLLRTSVLDPAGRRFAEAYVTAFFNAIERDDAFYRPIVAGDQVKAFLDPNQRQPACGGEPLAAGSVVSEPLDTQGDLIHVHVIDMGWKWAPPKACDAIHAGAVWIPAKAVAADYPR
jgi:hypothetical protein